MTRTIGTAAFGLRAPIVKQGDDLVKIVVDTVLNSGLEIKDRDVLGITESIVARCEGNYVTIDEVTEDIKRKMGEPRDILVDIAMYSRNRFAMILKAIARAAKYVVYLYMPLIDEVGNNRDYNPFTGVNCGDYYKSIIEAEGKKCLRTDDYDDVMTILENDETIFTIDTKLHFETRKDSWYYLTDFCSDKCEYGLLGSNKASEELLKLFPSGEYSRNLVREVQQRIKDTTGKLIEVMVYGDGCFKDPVGGIWEFADPVVSPAYTPGLEGTPNEIKIKNFADEKYKNLHSEELNSAIKKEIENKSSDLKGNMNSQGTTPRRYTDLLGSLMDLTSGSGDKGTPFVYVQGYFDNMSND